ncbi:MAG: hypothetical protein KKB50_20990 [Planctomycetes bacterium]|nr:hypothetical protein [Planctomycetota bacterium]
MKLTRSRIMLTATIITAALLTTGCDSDDTAGGIVDIVLGALRLALGIIDVAS